MPAHLVQPSQTISLLGRRSRQDLILILVRAHRNGDAALVRDCQAELDHRWRIGRKQARTAAITR